jgi:hypothetical protein
MEIIYIPFAVDIFWQMIVIGVTIAFVGGMVYLGHMYGGINPYGRYP